MSTQAKVAIEKQEHPERFCPARRCLWRTAKLNHATGEREGGGYCPRHKPAARPAAITAMEWIRNGCQLADQPSGPISTFAEVMRHSITLQLGRTRGNR